MNRAKSLVSVIVPVYNSEKYLRYCIDSILNQSYSNLEVILVDDGSTDNSPAICNQYASKDSRVTVIHQKNGGIAHAQNTGLANVHGRYIAFVDNDDILDCHNIEYLLSALEITGADMSKARWQQFGVSQLDYIMTQAASGAREPSKITVFKNPLHAYQTVFCKTLRILGSALGRNTEARYFNEANWCRLYKKEIWDGLRFEVGHYAQDIRMAGPLYARMNSVADIDVPLYFWLQEPDSVTHSKRSPSFWHDNVSAAATNFQFTLQQGIIPYRNFFGLVASVRDERRGLHLMGDKASAEDLSTCSLDEEATKSLIKQLNLLDKLKCHLFYTIRRVENIVYDNRIHNMK